MDIESKPSVQLQKPPNPELAPARSGTQGSNYSSRATSAGYDSMGSMGSMNGMGGMGGMSMGMGGMGMPGWCFLEHLPPFPGVFKQICVVEAPASTESYRG